MGRYLRELLLQQVENRIRQLHLTPRSNTLEERLEKWRIQAMLQRWPKALLAVWSLQNTDPLTAHAKSFFQCFLKVVRLMQHNPQEDEVETAIGKWQGFRYPFAKIS